MKLRKGNGGSKSRMETSPLIVLHVATSLARGHGDRSELQKLKVATKIFRGTSRFWLHLLEKKGGKKVD